jgi:hypothetical protein
MAKYVARFERSGNCLTVDPRWLPHRGANVSRAYRWHAGLSLLLLNADNVALKPLIVRIGFIAGQSVSTYSRQ